VQQDERVVATLRPNLKSVVISCSGGKTEKSSGFATPSETSRNEQRDGDADGEEPVERQRRQRQDEDGDDAEDGEREDRLGPR
jgi:hypothetical protein